MPKCALPPHLQNKLHNDWVWPLSLISRGSNAFGPRCRMCKNGNAEGYLAWPPQLVEGYDVTRWEQAGGNSILWLPDLRNKFVTAKDVYSRTHLAMEMVPGHPNFMKEQHIYFPFWHEATVTDIPIETEPGKFRQFVNPDEYSPSALQKFSWDKGFVKYDPLYTAKWKIIKKREWPFQTMGPDGPMGPDKEDIVFFKRDHNRPDHVDAYYNGRGLLPLGYVGLKWE